MAIEYYRIEDGQEVSCWQNPREPWGTYDPSTEWSYIELSYLKPCKVYQRTYYYDPDDKNLRELDLLLLETRLERGQRILALNTGIKGWEKVRDRNNW
jgi:hypothetical protein